MSASGIYPMRVVARLTGLTPDTIRAWERRYQAITPDRTGGNARRYRDQDIQRLTRLAALTGEGHSISSLAGLSDEALVELTRSLASATGASGASKDPARLAIERYLEAVTAFDSQTAEELLKRAASALSPREAALDLIGPIMREVGERWAEGELTIAQEHLVSAHAQGLLGALLRSQSVAKGAARVVVAAPPGHTHDIGVLIAALLCAARGVIAVHLGANVPYADLRRAQREVGASVVVLSVTRDLTADEAAAARTELASLAKEVEVWVGAPPGNAMALMPGVRAFDSFESFDTAVLHRFPGG